MEQQLQASGEQSLIMDSDLSNVGESFKSVMSQMKNTLPFWDDLIQRGIKFQRQLEATIVAYNFFADGFSKVADIAVRSKGGTRDLGTQLTTLAMWHKQLELKFRGFNQALATNFLSSMQGKIEEFRKSASSLEKECDRELKKSVSEAKGAFSKTVKTSKSLEKKTKKEKFDEVHALRTELSKKQQEASDRVQMVYDIEKRHLTKLLVEERVWYCTLVRDYHGVMNAGVSLITDLQRLQDISQELSVTIDRPSVLPEKTVNYITEVCPLASQFNNDLHESIGMPASQRRGSYTPQPPRSVSSSSGLSQRSQSFDQLDDPTFYAEIPAFTSNYPVSPLASSHSANPSVMQNTAPPPPPPPVYSTVPSPPPPPVHRASHPVIHKEASIYPEDLQPLPSTAMTDHSTPPSSRHSGMDWHSDLKAKLRQRAESVGNCSPKRPGTPIEEQLYVDVVPPSHRSLSVSISPPPIITGQVPVSMTPPMRRSGPQVPPQVPPQCLPKPSRNSILSFQEVEEDPDDSPLAKALKAAKLKKTAAVNDRSAPRM